MQSRWRRRRHQASPRSVLESDGQVSVRVIKAGGTTEGILNIKHFTLPSLGIEKSLSLYKVCTSAPQSPSLPPIYKHSVSTFSRISAQMRRNFSINLLKTMSVRLQMRAVRFSLHDYRCRTFHHNIIITISAEKWFFSFVYFVSFFGKSVTLKIRVDGGDRLWNRNCAESAQKEQ